MRSIMGPLNVRVNWVGVGVVILLVIMSLSIKSVTSEGIAGQWVLFLRSAMNLVIAFAIVIARKSDIRPVKPVLQGWSFLLFGLSLLLVFSAYEHLSAGTVTTLQRLDIPTIVILGAMTGTVVRKEIGLALTTFLVVAINLWLSGNTQGEPIGYILMLGAVMTVAISTLIQKRIAVSEQVETVMVFSCLSSLIWSGGSVFAMGITYVVPTGAQLSLIGFLALVNTALFYLVYRLYRAHTPEFVRYIYLWAAMATVITEIVIGLSPFQPIVVGGNLVIIVLLGFLIRSREARYRSQAILDA
jgi:hypothetical protein